MSIDVRLVPLNDNIKITKEFLLERIPSDLELIKFTESENEEITFFQVSPTVLSNPENIPFEFHLQEDGSWWHPVYTRSDDGFELDQEIVDLVITYLRLEQDFSKS